MFVWVVRTLCQYSLHARPSFLTMLYHVYEIVLTTVLGDILPSFCVILYGGSGALLAHYPVVARAARRTSRLNTHPPPRTFQPSATPRCLGHSSMTLRAAACAASVARVVRMSLIPRQRLANWRRASGSSLRSLAQECGGHQPKDEILRIAHA